MAIPTVVTTKVALLLHLGLVVLISSLGVTPTALLILLVLTTIGSVYDIFEFSNTKEIIITDKLYKEIIQIYL